MSEEQAMQDRMACGAMEINQAIREGFASLDEGLRSGLDEQEVLGEVPIYRYDPKASAAEEEPWAEGTQIALVNSDGEVVGTGVVGPRVEIEGFDGWTITVPEESA